MALSCPELPYTLVLIIFQLNFFQLSLTFNQFLSHTYDTNQVNLNCLEGSVYILSYLWPFRATNRVTSYWVMCTFYTPRTHWVMGTFHIPLKYSS